MKIAIRNNELYKDYAKRFTDEQITAEPYNYKIYEVGEIPNDCAYSDFEIKGNSAIFNEPKYKARKQEEDKDILREKREVLLTAFDKWEKAVLRGRETDSVEVMTWYENLLDLLPSAFEEIPIEVQYYL